VLQLARVLSYHHYLSDMWHQHLRESGDPRFGELTSEIESLLAEGGVELSLSVCFAAAQGNIELMKQVLGRGEDPNKADYSGRTPLVRNTLKPNTTTGTMQFSLLFICHFPFFCNIRNVII
jgi:hypothetical protein